MGGICGGTTEGITVDEWIREAPAPCADKECDGWIEKRGAVRTEWQYVGEGKGGFNQVQRFNYVGEGRGRYNKESTTEYHGWRLGKFGTAIAVALTVLGAILLLARLLHAQKATSTTRKHQKFLYTPQGQPVNATGATEPSHFQRHGSASRATLVDARKETPVVAQPFFNCTSHYFNQPWTADKAGWCCRKHSIGCATTTRSNRPASGVLAAAPELGTQQQHLEASDTDREEFNCTEDYNDWQRKWSRRKQDWCCIKHDRGCPFDA